MNPSERIRAALSRSAARPPNPPTLQAPPEVEPTLPLTPAGPQGGAAPPQREPPQKNTRKWAPPPVRLPKREKVDPEETAAPEVEASNELTPSRSRRTPLIVGLVVVVIAAGVTAFLLRD